MTESEAAERELSELLEGSSEGAHGLDPDGTIAWMNQAELTLLGFERAELVGHHAAKIHADPAVLRALLERHAGGEQDIVAPARLVTKDGVELDVVLHCKALYAEGRLERVRCFTHNTDATRRVEHDRALLAAIIESSDDAIISKDLDGEITSWNRGAERIFGYRAEEVVGRPVTMLMPPDRFDEEPGILDRLRRGERIDHYETVRKHKDGSLINISMSVSPIRDEEGRVIGASKVARDVTHQRRSEQRILQAEDRYRRLAEVLPVGVYACDAPDGRITFFNRHATRMWRTAPELGGLHHEFSRGFKMQRPDGTPIAPENAPVVVALRSGRRFRNEEVVLERPDGTRMWLLVNIDPVHDADGGLSGVVCAFLDVTAMKQAEQALREADRRKDEFLATLAHELRNPLAPILFGLEVMRMVSGDPATVEQALGTIERQTRQLIRLVDDLLDVSRITRGRLELRKARVRVADVIREAVETARPAIAQSGHTLEVRLTDEALVLDADPNRLAQVLSNLLNNAAKYTPPGGDVRVRVERAGDQVEITVEDTGIGIPAGMHERIFELFAQVDRPQERGYTGLGIGLTLARSLIEMHGGSVVAHSAPGGGSLFRVRLPLADEASGERAARADVAAPEAVAPARRVLVVDDNEDAVRSLATMLRVLGYDVRTATDGRQAIDVAGGFRPHVVLMDLGMPGMTGYEAARTMREQPWGADIQLVALSGWGQEEHKRRTREAGFDLHVVKPIEPADLKRLLT